MNKLLKNNDSKIPQDSFSREAMGRIRCPLVILGFLLGGLIWTNCYAYTDVQLANAIFKAEGGYKARYLYGIVSVKYKDEAEARRICLNTIRNHIKRHKSLKYPRKQIHLLFFCLRNLTP